MREIKYRLKLISDDWGSYKEGDIYEKVLVNN